MRYFPLCLLVIAHLASQNAPPARAENWPNWRGPAGNGSTTETNLPDHWSRTENVAWIATLPGRSGATPVIWEDSVFLPSPDADGNLLLMCINAKDGKIRWQKTVASGNDVIGKNNMASPSAATDGKHVVVIFGTGDLAAFDFVGKQLWSRNLTKESGKFALNFLYGSSPLLNGGKLYVEVLQRADPKSSRSGADDKPARESYLLCLDLQTGSNLWRQVRKTDAVAESQEAYTTPVIRKTDHGAEILVGGGDYVTAHDPETGAELWRSVSVDAKKSRDWRTIATPVTGPDRVFVCLPRAGSPMFALAPGSSGDKTAVAVAWKNTLASSDVPSPLYYQDRIFVLNGGKQMLICVDPKTGATKWSGRLNSDETFSASPTGADGKIYCISEGGTVVVVSAGDEFKILSHFTMEGEATASPASRFGMPQTLDAAEGGPILSTIAVANGHLFVRTPKSLYCVGAK